MENQIFLDTSLFLYSVALGLLFGLYFEFFRFLRLALPHPWLFVFLEDLLFFLPTTFVFLLFTFAFSDGILRWFSSAGVGIGFFLYLGTLGKLISYFAGQILRFVYATLSLCYRFTVKPIVNVIKKVTFILFTKIKKAVIIRKKKVAHLRLEKQKRALLSLLKKGALEF